MPAPADFAQRANEAIVAVLDTHASVVAITARASSNIVAAAGLVDGVADAKPVIAYTLGDAKQISVSDYRLPALFTFVAFDAATANALRNAVDAALTNPALAGVTNPIDVYRERWEETFRAAEYDDEGEVWVSTLDVALVGSVRAAAPAGNPNLPPVGGAPLLAFDPGVSAGAQIHPSVVGPDWQLGGTSGADTADPTYEAGPPPRYAYGAGQYLTAGDALDAELWTLATGWTVLIAMRYQGGSIDPALRTILSKYAAAAEFGIFLLNGKPYLEVFDGTGFITWLANDVLAQGRHTFAVKWNPQAAVGSRLRVLVDGVVIAGAESGGAANPAIPNTATTLRIGTSDSGLGPVAEIGNVYGWAGQVSDADLAADHTWLRDTKGWQ